MGIRRKTGFAPEMELELVLLLERHRGTLYTVCRSFHPDDLYRMHALYNDIVYNLWNRIRLFRNKKDEAAWVYRVAVNTAINSDKSESRIPEMVPFTQDMEQIPEKMEGDPLMEELYALTEQLDSRENNLLHSRHAEELRQTPAVSENRAAGGLGGGGSHDTFFLYSSSLLDTTIGKLLCGTEPIYATDCGYCFVGFCILPVFLPQQPSFNQRINQGDKRK